MFEEVGQLTILNAMHKKAFGVNLEAKLGGSRVLGNMKKRICGERLDKSPT